MVLPVLTSCCCTNRSTDGPSAKPEPIPIESPTVWVVDDGERIARMSGALPLMQGEGNATWKPGGPARLFGLPGETIAFQVVVSAGKEAIEGATVDLPVLSGPSTIRNPEGKGPESFRALSLQPVATSANALAM